MNDSTDVGRILGELRRGQSRLEERRDGEAVIQLLRQVATTEVGDVTISVTTGSAASMRVASDARSPKTEREIAFTEVADTEDP